MTHRATTITAEAAMDRTWRRPGENDIDSVAWYFSSIVDVDVVHVRANDVPVYSIAMARSSHGVVPIYTTREISSVATLANIVGS